MVTQVGVTGVCITGVALIAVENIANSHDPFPQLLVGGLFTAACAVVSEIDTGLAMGVAVTFLTATVVLHSTALTTVITSLAGSASSPAKSNASPYGHGVTPTSTTRKA